jgi:outer membrane protein assembly factor BamB
MTRLAVCFVAGLAWGQGWTQWGQNPRHTGAVSVAAQRPEVIQGEFLYDPLADAMREDSNGNLLVHYMSPIVDGQDVFMMTREGEWRSCREFLQPCGTALWSRFQWNVTRLQWEGGKLSAKWTTDSRWKPAPDTGSRWEPVFHPVLVGRYIYAPSNAGMVMKIDRDSGRVMEQINPFGEENPNMYVAGPLTADEQGNLYYNAIQLAPTNPWTTEVAGAWLVKIGADGTVARVSFGRMNREAPATCRQTFAEAGAAAPLPWPPTPDAVPPSGPCGRQRPGLNVAPAVGADGTIYTVSRAHFNASHGYLVALDPNLRVKWISSLRDRLNDGCDVSLPASGTRGGCRAGATRGVDPTTNTLPAGQVMDLSTASPVVAPDGSILYGAFTGYNHFRGHLMKFSPAGDYLAAYDFGWDTTPAVYPHDGTYSVLLKDNHYGATSYCGNVAFCLPDERRYDLVSLNADLRKEWNFRSTNTQACERQPDGTTRCETQPEGFEWCVNMVAVDRNGVMYANSEDGNLYAVDRNGSLVSNLFLKVAIGAAYTPLAIGGDGRIYTQNAGSLFVVGAR